MGRHLVFVYGTLKKGQPNNYFIQQLQGVKFLGRAVTCQEYPLIIERRWNLPLLLKIEGQGKNVKGEVIEVDEAALLELDDFEGHPVGYKRDLAEVELVPFDGCISEDSGTRLSCWVYFGNNYSEDDINLPHYEDYDSYGDHGFEYDIKENEYHTGKDMSL